MRSSSQARRPRWRRQLRRPPVPAAVATGLRRPDGRCFLEAAAELDGLIHRPVQIEAFEADKCFTIKMSLAAGHEMPLSRHALLTSWSDLVAWHSELLGDRDVSIADVFRQRVALRVEAAARAYLPDRVPLWSRPRAAAGTVVLVRRAQKVSWMALMDETWMDELCFIDRVGRGIKGSWEPSSSRLRPLVCLFCHFYAAIDDFRWQENAVVLRNSRNLPNRRAKWFGQQTITNKTPIPRRADRQPNDLRMHRCTVDVKDCVVHRMGGL